SASKSPREKWRAVHPAPASSRATAPATKREREADDGLPPTKTISRLMALSRALAKGPISRRLELRGGEAAEGALVVNERLAVGDLGVEHLAENDRVIARGVALVAATLEVNDGAFDEWDTGNGPLVDRHVPKTVDLALGKLRGRPRLLLRE